MEQSKKSGNFLNNYKTDTWNTYRKNGQIIQSIKYNYSEFDTLNMKDYSSLILHFGTTLLPCSERLPETLPEEGFFFTNSRIFFGVYQKEGYTVTQHINIDKFLKGSWFSCDYNLDINKELGFSITKKNKYKEVSKLKFQKEVIIEFDDFGDKIGTYNWSTQFIDNKIIMTIIKSDKQKFQFEIVEFNEEAIIFEILK